MLMCVSSMRAAEPFDVVRGAGNVRLLTQLRQCSTVAARRSASAAIGLKSDVPQRNSRVTGPADRSMSALAV